MSQLISVNQKWQTFAKHIKMLLTDQSNADKHIKWIMQNNLCLLEEMDKVVGSMQTQSENKVSHLLSTQLVGIFLGIIAMVFAVITIITVVKRLDNLNYFAKQLGEGNLTVTSHDFASKTDLYQRDELGNLVAQISQMADNLNGLVGQIQRSGIQIASSTTELAATARQQKLTMVNQVTSTNNVMKSVEEISNVIAYLVEIIEQVTTLSEDKVKFARYDQTNLLQMEEAMHNMENASKSISSKLAAISEKMENITNVVVTITKVADQTNLLSLNAAIEAEKAGEYGRGFNVVAREIRRLADQTAVATLDIERMVKEMQSAISIGVMEMDKFICNVQQSAKNVAQISNQLIQIIKQVQNLAPNFELVNSATVKLNEDMQQTAASLEESFHAIEQLNDTAKELQDEVSRFKVS